MSTTPQRYFIGHDCSSHTYLVPVERRLAWEKWTAIPEDDERSWTPPRWARRIDGTHSITFTDPQENA